MLNPQDAKKNILVIGDGMSLAHVARALMVARKLLREGHKVTFATSSHFHELVRREGFEPREVYCIPPSQALETIRRGSHIFDPPTLRAYVASDINLIESVSPDLIVSDMRMSLNISAELTRTEYWSIVSGYLTRYYSAPQSAPETFPGFRYLGKRLGKIVHGLLKPAVLRQFASGFNRVRRESNLLPIDNVLRAIESPYNNLIADLPEYIPCTGLPGHFRYIGPLLWEPNVEVPEWISRIDYAKPSVYVTLGSTGAEEHLTRIAESLCPRGYQLLVTTGGKELSLPDGCFVTPFARGADLLPKSSAVICHGGSGTVYQAIANGVPVIGIPAFHDHEINLDRVVAMNWGCRISPFSVTERSLLGALERATSAQIKESVLRGKQLIVDAGQRQEAEPLIPTVHGAG